MTGLGLERASAPTLYFFGVTTTKSSIMTVFPKWAKSLGLKDAVIKGVDFPLHAPAKSYPSCGHVFEERSGITGRAGHDTQDRPLSGLPRSFRCCRSPCAAHGRDELSFEARRRVRLPRQGPDLLRPRARRIAARAPFRADGRRSLLDRRRRLDHRADLAFDAEGARRRPAVSHRGLGSQSCAPRGDPARPCRAPLRRPDQLCPRCRRHRQ